MSHVVRTADLPRPASPPTEEEPSMSPEPKQRGLSETEKAQIRERIQQGDDNIYTLAQEFACSSSQIAGLKAALHRYNLMQGAWCDTRLFRSPI